MGEGRGGRGGKRRAGELKYYIHTDRHTDPLTKRVIEELSLLEILCVISNTYPE